MSAVNQSYRRAWHEVEAIRHARDASRLATRGTMADLVKANREIAHARTHLLSLGLATSTRTDRLWAIVCRADRHVTTCTERALRAMEAA